MVAMSVPQMGRAGKVASSTEGRGKSSVSAIGQNQNAILSRSPLFSSLLKEHDRKEASEDNRTQNRISQKKETSSPVTPSSQSGSVSSSLSLNVENIQKQRTDVKEKATQKVSDNKSDDSQPTKTASNDSSESQQDWLLQQMLALTPLLSGQQSQVSSQDAQQNEDSTASVDDEGETSVSSVAVSSEHDSQQGTNSAQAQNGTFDGQLEVETRSTASSLKENPPMQKPVLEAATGAAQPLPQFPLPQKQSTTEGAQHHDMVDSLKSLMMSGGNGLSSAQQAGVQLSHVSVTSSADHGVTQGEEASQAAVSHEQEMRVDSASYLNAKETTFYANPSSQVAVAAEQHNVRQASDPDVSHTSFLDGTDRSVEGSNRLIGGDSTQQSGIVAAQMPQASVRSMGQEQQNNQEDASSSDQEAQEAVEKITSPSDPVLPTSFQNVMTGSSVATQMEGRLSTRGESTTLHQTNEAEVDVEPGHSAFLLAQKRLSDSSSKLEMTLKTSQSTPVRVQVARLPEGVAAVSLQGADDATTKALTKSKHELLEQLNAAGIHATSVKIDVLPADLSGINNGHAQDQMNQNASSGGQQGHGGDASHKGQHQNPDGSRTVLSSVNEDDVPRRNAENIVTNFNTPRSATGGGLNISV